MTFIGRLFSISIAFALVLLGTQAWAGGNLAPGQTMKDLTRPQRLSLAKTAIGRALTPKEKTAVMQAHFVGQGQTGKDGGPARIGQYTRMQLLGKARILNKAGFTMKERRQLMKAGAVGFLDDLASVATAINDGVNTYQSTERVMSGHGSVGDYLEMAGQHESAATVKSFEDIGKGDYSGSLQQSLRNLGR
jgi:hypothetical protein